MARFRQGDAVSALATTEAILKEQPENLDALLLALTAQRRYHAATRTLKKGRYHSSYLIGLQYQAHTSFSLARDRTRLNELRVSLRSRMEQAFDPSEFADQLLSRFTVLAGNNTS